MLKLSMKLAHLTLILVFSVTLLMNSLSFAESSSLSREDRERLIRLEATLKEFKDSVDKRFEQIDKRFEQIDKRLEFMQQLMIAMIAVFGGLCGVFVGLLLWDRKTFKDKAKEEAMRELEAKYRINDWISALKEYAKEKEDLAKILRKLNLL